MAGNRLQYLSANDWTLIKAKSVRRTFKLGEEIIRQGALSESIFIIRKGEASVELAGTNSRAIVATLGADDICGDIAFLEKGRATAAVIAKDTEVEVDEVNAEGTASDLRSFSPTGFAFLSIDGDDSRTAAEGYLSRTGAGNGAPRSPQLARRSQIESPSAFQSKFSTPKTLTVSPPEATR
jgi:hypothetical protein